MKVSSGVSQSLQQAQAQQTESNKGLRNPSSSPTSSSSAADSSAQVHLSPRAKQVQQATDIAKNDSVDEAKIARFQNLIDSGKYQVDSAKVADRLVDSHMKMPS